jgi:hypothetical protein
LSGELGLGCLRALGDRPERLPLFPRQFRLIDRRRFRLLLRFVGRTLDVYCIVSVHLRFGRRVPVATIVRRVAVLLEDLLDEFRRGPWRIVGELLERRVRLVGGPVEDVLVDDGPWLCVLVPRRPCNLVHVNHPITAC